MIPQHIWELRLTSALHGYLTLRTQKKALLKLRIMKKLAGTTLQTLKPSNKYTMVMYALLWNMDHPPLQLWPKQTQYGSPYYHWRNAKHTNHRHGICLVCTAYMRKEKVFIQAEKYKRLETHPMNQKIQEPYIKCSSFKHLSNENQDIISTNPEEREILTPYTIDEEENQDITVYLNIPDIETKAHQSVVAQKALTLEHLSIHYPS